MTVEIEIKDGMFAEYCNARNNISLVIKYLEALKTTPPDEVVNNESIRLLLESLKLLGDVFTTCNELPITITELELQNHIQKVKIKKLEKEIDGLKKLKL